MSSTPTFIQARDFLLAQRDNYAAAYAGFHWPCPEHFNWATDYFDNMAQDNERLALRVVDDQSDCRVSFDQLSRRSNQVANFLRAHGVTRGDRILVLLPSVLALWEIMLAAMKLGAIVSPAAPLLTAADLQDRVTRGEMRHVITDRANVAKCADLPASLTRIVVDGSWQGWHSYAEADGCSPDFAPDAPTGADDPVILYFTSGTTAKPKMVLHSQRSYPIGHLSTMYWIGLRPDDVHYNISSPGWAKHAWSSYFAPWNAGAAVFVFNQPRFDARRTLDVIARHEVTTLCAPPTVWRMLVLEDLAAYKVKLREVVSAGEPLNPEVIERVQNAWGLTIRDGYGQTETTALVGNSPGQLVKSGSMGRPLPGYKIEVLDAEGHATQEGEVAVDLSSGSAGDSSMPPALTSSAQVVRFYRTSDAAGRDADGYFWFVGRADDIFKSSDYRISPFEIESALLEHEAVAEAAVVPSPDPVRLCVPKAFVVLKPGAEATRETARALFQFLRERLAPYQRVRRIEFSELPKTISGKIRRVELRKREIEQTARKQRGANEYWEEDVLR